ncbi:hypothetical protein FN846DRAFT_1008305 [Sphaerosporella brunnea]|uniref:Uncharacterized protein n=1 Tax=Sphaerosporella brunnea TaxID=1250544 RepID=A0A5J5ECX1_9PEZI|nr:hypothetical protein FN846DRAFT_1008305 [Sphaerosporella brunnea]
MQNTSPEVPSATPTVPPPAIPLADFAHTVEELLGRHLAALKEGYDTSLANLVKVVLELRETAEELSVQSRALQTQLSGPQRDAPRYRTLLHAASQTPPLPPPPLAPAETTATPPEVTARPKRRRSGPPSPTVQPAKQEIIIFPPPSLMHSKHAGASTALVSIQADPETQPAPGNPEADAPPSGGTEAEGAAAARTFVQPTKDAASQADGGESSLASKQSVDAIEGYNSGTETDTESEVDGTAADGAAIGSDHDAPQGTDSAAEAVLNSTSRPSNLAE